MPRQHGDAYEVGYRRPPKAHQFKPGQSGNPRGRRRKQAGHLSLIEALLMELQQLITIREGGKELTVTKRDAMLKRLVTDSIIGKPASLKLLCSILYNPIETTIAKNIIAVPDLQDMDPAKASRIYQEFIAGKISFD